MKKPCRADMKGLFHLVNEVLLVEWDPIGVSDDPNAQDEYESYALTIVGMLIKGTTKEDISQFLSKVELRFMGLTPDEQRNQNVVSKILDLRTGETTTR